MRTRTTLVAVALAVAAVAAIPVAGLAATGGPVLADQHNATNANASVAPGEQLSGVVGVQEAELEGEVDERAFGLRVARAATNEARADVVAGQFDDIRQRLAALDERRQELERARENGSMSEGTYRAEVTELAARTQTTENLANSTETATRGMPADLLESKGVNVTAIQTLKERAEALTGPEVAEIARSIAGNAAPVDPGPPESVPDDGGPPDERAGQEGSDAGQGGPPEDRQGGSDDGSDGQETSDQQSDAGTPTPTPDDGDDSDRGAGQDNAGGNDDRGGGR